MNGELAGYLAALSAVFFFGTNYVPAKQYATYDGIIFQWFMCSGILMVGLAWGLVSNNWVEYAKGGLYTFPEGILGGSLFALANLLIPTVVNNLGLGIGFMLWNATNIFLGYLISRFGFFGVEPTLPAHPWVSALGIAFMLASIAVYGRIQPTLAPPKKSKSALPTTNSNSNSTNANTNANSTNTNAETTPLLPGGISVLHPSMLLYRDSLEEESLHEALMHPELPNFGPYTMAAVVSEHVTLVDQRAEQTRRAIGVVLALIVGAFLSCCLVPYVNWQQRCQPSVLGNVVVETCNPLDFVFSQCLGIYITSTLVFMLYSLFSRFVVRRQMPRSVMRPSYMCGILWALGLASQLFAMGKLGFDQVYPLSSIGPAMVSMLWSAWYFREIQGTKNQQILVVATSMVLVGTVLRVWAA